MAPDEVPIAELPGIGRVAARALAERGIATLSQVASLTEAQLHGVHGVGPKAVRILRDALEESGMRFRA